MGKTSIQMQSVLYCNNDKESIARTLLSVSNAVRVADEFYGLELDVTFVYGDASPIRLFSSDEIKLLQTKAGNRIEIRYYFFNENTGSARGHNVLTKETDSDYIVIMNPDVKLSPDFFYYCLMPFADSAVGIVEARQTPVEHSKEYNIKTLETKWATTACAMISRKVFDMMGGFDADSFFLYCDDVDFSWRARLKGYKIIYQPLALAFHDKELSVNGKWMPTQAERYYSCFASIMMAYKWSNDKLAVSLLRMFSESPDEYEKKAAEEFKDRQKKGTLPPQLDKEHRIAEFNDGFYCKHRYIMPVEDISYQNGDDADEN